MTIVGLILVLILKPSDLLRGAGAWGGVFKMY